MGRRESEYFDSLMTRPIIEADVLEVFGMPLCEKCAGQLYWQPVPISEYDRRDRSLWTVRAKERRTFVCGDCL